MDHRAVAHQSTSNDLAYEGMTTKQWAYCHARADGLNQSDAYRLAYPGQSTTDKQVGQESSGLERDPRVARKIRNLLAEKRQGSSLVPQVERIEVSKDWVVQGIANLAQDKAVKANTRLAAYIAVGKTAGIDAFRDIVVHQKQPKTIEEIDAEIAAHLSKMIDVTPNAPDLHHLQVDARPAPPAPQRDRRRKPVT